MEKKKTIRLTRPGSTVKGVLTACGLAALFVVSVVTLDLDIVKFFTRLPNVSKILPLFLTLDFSQIGNILADMVASVAIAFSALAIGTLISVVLGFLAASNTAPSRILAGLIKGGVAVVRAIPVLVWMLMVVASVGFGNTGGIIGVIIPTVGYLTRSFVSSIEEMGTETIEAMRAVGAGWTAIVVRGLLPGLTAIFLSWIAIRLEGNIAESINLGMVGVGGIGSLLMKALNNYDYGSITVIILVIFLTLLVTEFLVNGVKRRIKE